MPGPNIASLPPAPTPQQVAKFVVDAASEVVQTVVAAAATAQDSIETTGGQAVEAVRKTAANVDAAARTAMHEVRAGTDSAKRELQAVADRSVDDFQRLVSELLKIIGHVPAPTDFAIGDVNGEAFFEPFGCFVLFMRAIHENKTPIKVRLREPTVAQAFREFVGSTQDEIARKAREKLIPGTSVVSTAADPVSGAAGAVATVLASVPPAVWIILSIAAVILAVGVSIFVVLMGIAIIYALYRGYSIKDLRLEFNTPLFGVTFGADFEKP